VQDNFMPSNKELLSITQRESVKTHKE